LSPNISPVFQSKKGEKKQNQLSFFFLGRGAGKAGGGTLEGLNLKVVSGVKGSISQTGG